MRLRNSTHSPTIQQKCLSLTRATLDSASRTTKKTTKGRNVEILNGLPLLSVSIFLSYAFDDARRVIGQLIIGMRNR